MDYEELDDSDYLKGQYKLFKNGKHSIEEMEKLSPFSDKTCIQKINTSTISTENDYFKKTIELHEISSGQGLYFIANPFRGNSLNDLMKEIITSWSTSEHKMNLDIESNRPDHVWKEAINQINSGMELKKTWLNKLRWISLGYQYHWTEKTYKAGNQSAFPKSLASLSRDLARIAGFPEFIPEAGIVNVYHHNSSMGFHVDHAEIAQEVPLVSLSMGQPCIFQLGGQTRTDPVTSFLLRHGDVIIMSGPSRLAYHAVPRVIVDPVPSTHVPLSRCPWCDNNNSEISIETLSCDSLECQILANFAANNRINVNVRQVLRKGENFPI